MKALNTIFKLTAILVLLISSTDLFATKGPKVYDAYIRTTEKRKIKGRLLMVNNEGVKIHSRGKDVFLSAESISRIKIKHKNASGNSMITGALLGAYGGVATSKKIIEDDGSPMLAPIIIMNSFIAGGLVGSVGSAFFKVARFKNVNSNYTAIYPKLSKYSTSTESSQAISQNADLKASDSR